MYICFYCYTELGKCKLQLCCNKKKCRTFVLIATCDKKNKRHLCLKPAAVSAAAVIAAAPPTKKQFKMFCVGKLMEIGL